MSRVFLDTNIIEGYSVSLSHRITGEVPGRGRRRGPRRPRPAPPRREVHFALENDGWNCTFECKVHVSAFFGVRGCTRRPAPRPAGPVRSPGTQPGPAAQPGPRGLAHPRAPPGDPRSFAKNDGPGPANQPQNAPLSASFALLADPAPTTPRREGLDAPRRPRNSLPGAGPENDGRASQILAIGARRSMRRLVLLAPSTVKVTWATVERPVPSRATTSPSP